MSRFEAERSEAMTLLLCREAPSEQTEATDSFQGGQPKLPPGIATPKCSWCGAALTFFFQLAFPASHGWSGHSLALFACTSCVADDALIPEMLPGRLAEARVTRSYLERYQTNFRTLVFETSAARIQRDRPARVQFARLTPCNRREAAFAGVGGSPAWLLEDEAPREVAGSKATFLFQLRQGLEFQTTKEAPPQAELGLDGAPVSGVAGRYELFLGNAVYFFGAARPDPLVYLLTQVD